MGNANTDSADTADEIDPNDEDGDGTPRDEDCDDHDAKVGTPSLEVCDGLDNDCDGWTEDTCSASISVTAIAYNGENEYDNASTVAAAGDVNGDGYADILVGAPGYVATSADTGRGIDTAGAAYLIPGGPALAGGSMGEQGTKWEGVRAFDSAGTTVAGIGDANGDGFDDFVVGTSNWGPEYYEPEGRFGALVLGGPTLAPGLLGDALLFDSPPGDDGWAGGVSRAGDVNGDGFKDFFVLGASGNTLGVAAAGVAYVVFGSASPTPHTIDTDGAVFVGEDVENGGLTVAFSGGDINGDGVGDIVASSIVGAYVFFGDNGTGAIDAADAAAKFSVSAETDFLSALAGEGDVNGDGLDDVLIGDYSDGDGHIFLILGGASMPSVSVDGAQARYRGGGRADWSLTAAIAGDIDNDGRAETIIGANRMNNLAGGAFTVFGEAAPPSLELDPDNAQFIGAEDSWAGSTVAGAGDATGDGIADLLVGAPGGYAGSVYLLAPNAGR